MSWTPELLAIAQKMSEDHTYNQIASYLSKREGVPYTKTSVRSALRRYREGKHYAMNDMPDTKMRPFEAPLYMEEGAYLILSDIHLPYHNSEFIILALQTAKIHGVTRVIIIGDSLNLESVSSYEKSPNESLEEEIDLLGELLVYILSFDNIEEVIICSGNHDERLQRKLGTTELGVSKLVELALFGRDYYGQVIVTDYDYVYVGDNWLVGHLSTFSRIPGNAASKLATRHRRNVAVGHDHMQGYMSTSDGEYIGISVGSMIAKDKNGRSPLWYRERRLSTYPEIANGFLILYYGVPYLYNDRGRSSLNGGESWSNLREVFL